MIEDMSSAKEHQTQCQVLELELSPDVNGGIITNLLPYKLSDGRKKSQEGKISGPKECEITEEIATDFRESSEQVITVNHENTDCDTEECDEELLCFQESTFYRI